jgi:hypothetical protein
MEVGQYPIIDINLLFTPEGNIEEQLHCAAVECNEFGNSLDLFLRLKSLSDAIESTMPILKESALRIAQREKEFMGIKLGFRQNKTYEYSDPIVLELQKKISERQALAKHAFTLGLPGVVVPETGEFIEAAKIKTSSESILLK